MTKKKIDLSEYHDKITLMNGGYLICFEPYQYYDSQQKKDYYGKRDKYWFGFAYNDTLYSIGWEDSFKQDIIKLINTTSPKAFENKITYMQIAYRADVVIKYFKAKYPEMLVLLPNIVAMYENIKDFVD